MKHHNRRAVKSRSPPRRTTATRDDVGNIEMSESKATRRQRAGHSSYVDHLYGLDLEYASDSHSAHSGGSSQSSVSNPSRANQSQRSKSSLFTMPGCLVWSPTSYQQQHRQLEPQTLEYLQKTARELVEREMGMLKEKKPTIIETEAVVHKLVSTELHMLRADLETKWKHDNLVQLQWQKELENEINDLERRYDKLRTSVTTIHDSIASQKTMFETVEPESETHVISAELEAKLAALLVEIYHVKKDHVVMHQSIETCHNNIGIANTISTTFEEVKRGELSGDPDQDAFPQWLHSTYISREVLDKQLQELTQDLNTKVHALMEGLQATPGVGVATVASHRLDEQHVQLMIREAILRYDADKIALPDFALESAGGSIILARCSRLYKKKRSVIKLFGFPVWYIVSSPRAVIQPVEERVKDHINVSTFEKLLNACLTPEVHPGDCWAFEGSTGHVVIKTAYRITPTGFTLEHISKSLSPSGEITSAPKRFTVSGLVDVADFTGQWLGNYTYNDLGNPVQYFPAQVVGDQTVFNFFEIRVLSNHGNQEYTCVYRFRIHGRIYKPRM